MTRRWETGNTISMALCVWLAAVSVTGADEAVPLVTRQLADGSLVGWQFFCGEQDVTCGDVWQLRDDVLICRGTPKGYVYTAKKYEDFVELEFAAIGDALTVSVDGESILEVKDSTLTRGGVKLSATSGKALFRDIEVKVLKK